MDFKIFGVECEFHMVDVEFHVVGLEILVVECKQRMVGPKRHVVGPQRHVVGGISSMVDVDFCKQNHMFIRWYAGVCKQRHVFACGSQVFWEEIVEMVGVARCWIDIYKISRGL